MDKARQQLADFLAEDAVHDDVTSTAVVPADAQATATVRAVEAGTVAGIEQALLLAELAGVRARAAVGDGDDIEAGTVLIEFEGAARAILGLERTLLNMLSHLSGIATLTRAAIRSVAGTSTRIAATRKTLPGLRDLEKLAVRHGGGDPHRRDLSDAILIKENHLIFAPGVGDAVERARRAVGASRVEIEVETTADAVAAAAAGADIILLDNMSPGMVTTTLAALEEAGLRSAVEIECSGGITPETTRQYANAGADVISMGALTMSAPALDISLDIEVAAGRGVLPPSRS